MRGREAKPDETNPEGYRQSTEPAADTGERFYTPAEIAARWRVSVDTVIRIFRNEPGVLILSNPAGPHKRPYQTIRVPPDVLFRVESRLSLSNIDQQVYSTRLVKGKGPGRIKC